MIIATLMLATFIINAQGVNLGTINDYTNTISFNDQTKINLLLNDFLKEKQVYFTIFIFNSVKPDNITNYSQNFIDHTNLSREDIVFFLCKDGEMRLEAGKYKDILTEDLRQKIMKKSFAPKFRNKDWSGGLISGIKRIDKEIGNIKKDPPVIENISVTPPINDNKVDPIKDEKSEKSDNFGIWLIVMIVLISLFSLGTYYLHTGLSDNTDRLLKAIAGSIILLIFGSLLGYLLATFLFCIIYVILVMWLHTSKSNKEFKSKITYNNKEYDQKKKDIDYKVNSYNTKKSNHTHTETTDNSFTDGLIIGSLINQQNTVVIEKEVPDIRSNDHNGSTSNFNSNESSGSSYNYNTSNDSSYDSGSSSSFDSGSSDSGGTSSDF